MNTKYYLLLFSLLFAARAFSQADSSAGAASVQGKKIIVVPYPPMMYFSDADADLARFSKTDQPRVRNQMRLMLEKNVHHQLLSGFDAVSLISATSLNGEEDLKKIYAASHYFLNTPTSKTKERFSSNLFRKKNKKQHFFVSDSSVMVAEIQDPQLNAALYKKHHHDYILYISQFEINTSNKNSIEWLKQDYKRTYMVHYNVWDNQGKLVLAETLTLNAGGENELQEINDKYLLTMAEKLKEIIAASIK